MLCNQRGKRFRRACPPVSFGSLFAIHHSLFAIRTAPVADVRVSDYPPPFLFAVLRDATASSPSVTTPRFLQAAPPMIRGRVAWNIPSSIPNCHGHPALRAGLVYRAPLALEP